MSRPASVGLCALLFLLPAQAFAWGDEGHEIIGYIAIRYLEPAVQVKIDELLAGDATGLTPSRDLPTEATWADKYRDSDRYTTKKRYLETRNWHFADLELTGPSLASACFNHPKLPAGTLASDGPAKSCVADKIKQFSGELRDGSLPVAERRLALQFLLHLVGDSHQPLHCSDEKDAGGNDKKAVAAGIPAGSLHHYWDTEFVRLLGTDASTVADTLAAAITTSRRTSWSKGTPGQWAMHTFEVSKARAYGKLPTIDADGSYHLPQSYVKDATSAVRLQLERAGVRLSVVLNNALR